jgi:small subunit ribosomal protein S8
VARPPPRAQVLTIQMKYSPERERTSSPVSAGVQARPARVPQERRGPRVLGGLGVAVLSTSQGLMTDREARKRKVGGESSATSGEEPHVPHW